MSVTLTRGAEGLDRRGFLMDEIEAMQAAGILDPDEKFELIDGEIVPISAQDMPHMLWKSRLSRWLAVHLPRNLLLVPEGTLVLTERPATSFETDLLVFEPGPGARCIRPEMVRLAIEIADSSIGRDRDVKAPRYARYGVAELWIVDVQARETRQCRAPTAQGYGAQEIIPFAAPIAPAFDPGLSVAIQDLE